MACPSLKKSAKQTYSASATELSKESGQLNCAKIEALWITIIAIL